MSDRHGVRVVTLNHADSTGRTALAVVPAWGMNVVAMSTSPAGATWPIPVLEEIDFATIAMKPTSYGAPILGPTPGRVGEHQNGRFTFDGKPYEARPTRHGFLRDLSWEVVSASDDSIRAAVTVTPSGDAKDAALFPFAFTATYEVVVGAARMRSLIEIHNTADYGQPINIGWHPYLHRDQDARVHIPARSAWKLGDPPEATPTGEIVPLDPALGFNDGHVVEGRHWDDVFTDLESIDGRCRCWVDGIRGESSSTPVRTRRWVEVVTERRGDLRAIRNMQLYTPPGRQSICLEPLSAPPDAINLRERGVAAADPVVLEPGERAQFAIEMGILLSSRAE